jgi:hypothetical protein
MPLSLARNQNFPLPHTKSFNTFTQTWGTVIVWDKDHTMVNEDNVLRPNLLGALLRLRSRFPSWTHVVLTENSFASTCEMFDHQPELEEVFSMVLCRDNYFSTKAVRRYFLQTGKYWWFFRSRKVKREKIRRRERRVNDLFVGKRVVLIDDLHHGRVPNHSCVVPSKVWQGEEVSPGELDWPNRLEGKILSVLKRLYNQHPVPVTQ